MRVLPVLRKRDVISESFRFVVDLTSFQHNGFDVLTRMHQIVWLMVFGVACLARS